MDNSNINLTENPSKLSSYCNCSSKCISWSAIFLGALIAMGISFLLNLFAVPLGITAFIHTNAETSFAIGGFIALAIITIVSTTAGGWVAGSIGAKKNNCCSTCNYGCLYGFAAWCITLIAAIILAAPVGKFIANSMTALSNPVVVMHSDRTYSANQMVPVVESSHQSTSIVESSHQSTSINNTVITPEEAAKAVSMSGFLAFVLFFIGALASTFAGHCAFYRCQQKKCCGSKTPLTNKNIL